MRPVKRKKSKLSVLQILILGVMSSCFLIVVCAGFVLVIDNGQPLQPTFTTEMQISLEQMVAMTAGAAQTQTQALYTPVDRVTIMSISNGTGTFTPTVTLLPNDFIFTFQTNVALTPTSPLIYATPMFPPIQVITKTPYIYNPPPPSGGCCKYCTNSKPCGNSCISISKTCHQPPGCAC